VKASGIKLTRNGIAVTPEPGKPLTFDAAAQVMMRQRLSKKRAGAEFIPNPKPEAR
jgi:hypothetical protein